MKNTKKINLIEHYKKLLFFNFYRYKGNNYQLMREYFAQILITEIEVFSSLFNKKVLDVGGSRGEFSKKIHEKKKCNIINVDPYPGDYIWPNTVIAFADKLPFKNNEFDVVICRGVLEHIPLDKQQLSVNEMFRTTKNGGLCYIVIPPWYNPHAGHGLKPFHIFPFKLAKFLRQLIFRTKIKANSFEEADLFPITFARMQKLITLSGFKILATKDTHFRLHFLTKIPILREILVPAVAFICKKI